MSEQLWGDMLDLLKDIRDYLEKQDAIQERAKIDVPPKVSETQKPIKGGEAAGFKPSGGIAKQYVEVPKEKVSLEEETEEIEPKEETLTKQEDDEEELEELEEEEEEEKEVPEKDLVEVKSLLKDIKSALSVKTDIQKAVQDEVKRELPSTMHKMLRKMGFSPTRSDIVKLGLGEPLEIKKSEDIMDEKMKEADQLVDDLSKKSWQELGGMREKAGLFTPFPK